MPGVYLIWLEASQIALAAKPGQFVMVNCGEETFLHRPLSIHQVEDMAKEKLALLFAVKGKGTHWLSQRQEGDNLDLIGPLGNGFSLSPASSNLLLVAGGIGIAPLRFLAQEAVSRGHSVKLLLGAADSSRLYPGHFFLPEIEIITATEDGSTGKKGMVTGLLPGLAHWADCIFTCGPLPMYQTMVRTPVLKDRNIQVSLEVRMGCGLGFCYGCTVKTKIGLKQVCQDGPVFKLDEVLWDELND